MTRDKVLVCGGGIVGASTSYFLTQLAVKPHILEACPEAAAGASGKAGGFLARDWCDSGAVGPLARSSFDLHKELSESLGASHDYGYRPLQTFSLTMKESDRQGGPTKGTPTSQSRLPPWVNGSGTTSQAHIIGDVKSTAQVHPALLTNALLDASCTLGAQLCINMRVSGLDIVPIDEPSPEGDSYSVRGVYVNDQDVLEAGVVVLTLGPWTSLLASWLSDVVPKNQPSSIPLERLGHLLDELDCISALKAHSIVLQPHHQNQQNVPELASGSIGPQALFLNYLTNAQDWREPEVYPRPDKTVYICGMACSKPLPANANLVEPEAGAEIFLQNVAASVSETLSKSKSDLIRAQACFLPVPPADGLPIIGKVPGINGLYMAAGHSCWGILNAPATGRALADLIVKGSSDLDLGPFDPARFS
jgi:glycine/D-amino acid oxidase-like deaminating enzyme